MNKLKKSLAVLLLGSAAAAGLGAQDAFTTKEGIADQTISQNQPAAKQEALYQIRVTLTDDFAKAARNNPADPQLAPLMDVLKKHNATLKCQFDLFAGYVQEAEANGPENYPLYEWTKGVVDDPVKQEKYTKIFTLYVDGEHLYDKSKADPLFNDLKPMIRGPIIKQMFKYDDNPAHNPQPPQHP